jgi:hypothetical protein
MIQTPLQQIKDNYYKMSEAQFHYWMSQNIDTLMKEERNIIMKAYDRDVINGKQNWSITDGEKYYNLHYGGENKSGETSRGNQSTNENYSFEDGV